MTSKCINKCHKFASEYLNSFFGKATIVLSIIVGIITLSAPLYVSVELNINFILNVTTVALINYYIWWIKFRYKPNNQKES